jgi:uncharacterized protein
MRATDGEMDQDTMPAEGFGGVVDDDDFAEDERDIHDSAGLILRGPDGKVLFLKRGQHGGHPGEWDWPGGHVQAGETLMQGAIRETHEECGYKADPADLHEVSRKISEDIDFTAFICPVKEKFTPDLSRDEDGGREHDDFIWADLRDAPEPLHPSIKAALSDDFVDEIIQAGPKAMAAEDEAKWDALALALDAFRGDLLALDKASVREYDVDGRLHVALTPISKAMVCPYLGREIPDYETLGLEPGKIYKLLRDPKELEKAASTFNAIPLLADHTPTSADDHPADVVIGATGTDAVYEHPFLLNSLAVWTAEAIEAIENEDKLELSSSYRYRADMTPGTYEGERHDGVMRDLIGNHVASVQAGRCGPSVAVADSLGDDVKWALIAEALVGIAPKLQEQFA